MLVTKLVELYLLEYFLKTKKVVMGISVKRRSMPYEVRPLMRRSIEHTLLREA